MAGDWSMVRLDRFRSLQPAEDVPGRQDSAVEVGAESSAGAVIHRGHGTHWTAGTPTLSGRQM